MSLVNRHELFQCLDSGMPACRAPQRFGVNPPSRYLSPAVPARRTTAPGWSTSAGPTRPKEEGKGIVNPRRL